MRFRRDAVVEQVALYLGPLRLGFSFFPLAVGVTVASASYLWRKPARLAMATVVSWLPSAVCHLFLFLLATLVVSPTGVHNGTTNSAVTNTFSFRNIGNYQLLNPVVHKLDLVRTVPERFQSVRIE